MLQIFHLASTTILGVLVYVGEKILQDFYTLYGIMRPDSNSTKLLDHPMTKIREVSGPQTNKQLTQSTFLG
jgi:hypothetical protein